MQATGTFEIDLERKPPFFQRNGVSFVQADVEKRFSGPLEAHSHVHMLSAHGPVTGSAAYVALEYIEGRLDGRAGGFATAHLGTMGGGDESLTIPIVPDSGTGELVGIQGSMQIRIENGQHFYTIDWTLPEP